MTPVCLALGANLGERGATLTRAVGLLAREIAIDAVSDWLPTAPVGGPPGQGEYLNGSLLGRTALTAEELLAFCLATEKILGRERGEDVPRWAARTIDVDLIFYGAQIIDRPPELIVPHPRAHEREFVLRPLAQVAPDFVHPILQKTVRQLLAGLAEE